VNDGWAVAVAPTATAVLLALTPVAGLEYFLQWFGAGTAFGTLVAYRATRRNPRREVLPIQVRWGCVFVGIGVLYAGWQGVS
jgi:hypothetical protein